MQIAVRFSDGTKKLLKDDNPIGDMTVDQYYKETLPILRGMFPKNKIQTYLVEVPPLEIQPELGYA